MAAITRFETAVTIVTDKAMTIAGLSFTVTARAEQIPRTWTVIGLLLPKGSVKSFKFFAENIGSFSWLLIG
jgi:hypothetical protein